MAEIMAGKGIKAIAFYLPQYHPIPENDRAWGAGFTEWDSVKKARPLFPGHDQPRAPENGNYYSLLDPAVRRWQAELAKKHGIFGFCYYHYWFAGGKKLLEKPAEDMLADPGTDIPFCFSWANEPWTKKWDGGSGEIIVPQDYGGEADWQEHIAYLLPFFRDRRYITLNGRPLLLIYKPEDIPALPDMLRSWRKAVRRAGFPGLCLMIQSPSWYFSPGYDPRGFDYQVQFQPFFGVAWQEKNRPLLRIAQAAYRLGLKSPIDQIISARHAQRAKERPVQKRLDYDAVWETILHLPLSRRMIPCAFPDWDNTPRTNSGLMFLNAGPAKFGRYVSRLCRKIRGKNRPPLLFVNAWNEWGEGAYLEPDEKYHDAALRALSQALKEQEE